MDCEWEDMSEFYFGPLEMDEEYEFDALHFFDFTRAEFDSEIEEAERWFEISGDYPNSPFVVKLNIEKLLSEEVVPSSSSSKPSSIKTKSINSNSEIDRKHGVSHSNKNAKGKSFQVLQDTPISKTKSDKLPQTRISTLMKPTASHLAKLNKMEDLNSSYSCTRFLRSSMKTAETSSQSSTILDSLAIKRQKLEIGYLRKVVRLKHQSSLPHKASKKVTVPREPELETHHRALTRRYRNSSASRESGRPKEGSAISTRKINRKDSVTKASSSAKQIKRKPQVQQFQVSTVNKINSYASGDATFFKRQNSRGVSKPEKKEGSVFPVKTDSELIQEHPKSTDEKILDSPPTEQFTKLSMGPEITSNNISIKVSEKNAPDSFQPECWRCDAKNNHCEGPMEVH